ncbi:MAG: flagellin [Mangrovicoccus sp.]
MFTPTVGDLTQHYQISRQNSTLRQQLQSHVKELASGETSDLSKLLSGDMTAIAGIERGLDLNSAYADTITTATAILQGQADALAKARANVTEIGTDLLTGAEATDPFHRESILHEAKVEFESIVAALNTQVAGKALFSGAEVQQPSLSSSTSILSQLGAAVSGLTTTSAVLAAADAWFDTPGGAFETLIYQGSLTSDLEFKIAEGQSVTLDVNAGNQDLRDLVKTFALAALAADGLLDNPAAEQQLFMKTLGENLINQDRSLITVEARLGAKTEKLEEIEAANSAEKYALLTARQDLIGVDSAETIMKLTQLETQLEAMYTMTARISRLSLTEFL